MAFDLPHFLPYLLNQAAEAAGAGFQRKYRDRYGMLRTEWRVLFHLGVYGDLSATEICRRAGLHKTKVSRAVTALEKKRFLNRRTDTADRRSEVLSLTRVGQMVFRDLEKIAEAYEEKLISGMPPDERAALKSALVRLAAARPPS